MKVKESVFGSKPERRLYMSLESIWKSKYNIYHNLPYTNIIDISDAKIYEYSDAAKTKIVFRDLTEEEKGYLYKTSVDFTLCEKGTDKPLLSIEFDGLGYGFSHDDEYVEVYPSRDPKRKVKLDTKLRLANTLCFPFVVVSYDEHKYLGGGFKFTILDGIIGKLLADRQFRLRFEAQKQGFEQEIKSMDFTSKSEEQDYIDDWIMGLETEAELENDIIDREATTLETKIGRLVHKWTMSVEGFEEPPAPVLKGLYDTDTLKRRIEHYNNPEVKIGCKVTFQCKSGNVNYKDVSAEVLIRNFGMAAVSVAQNIARLLAASKALELWSSQKGSLVQ